MQRISFFQLNQGKWITQRTIYNICSDEIYTHQSQIHITPDKQEISTNQTVRNFMVTNLDLYMQNKFDQHMIFFMMKREKNSLNRNLIKKNNSNIINYFNICRNNMYYVSLKNAIGQLISFEKIWFINPNLRLSIGLIEKNNQCLITSFTSDIRIS